MMRHSLREPKPWFFKMRSRSSFLAMRYYSEK
jgi:hypothetical protein